MWYTTKMNLWLEQRLIYRNIDNQEKFPDAVEAKRQIEANELQSGPETQEAAMAIVTKSLRWIKVSDARFEDTLRTIGQTGDIYALDSIITELLEADALEGSEGQNAQEDLHLQIPEIAEAINNVGRVFSSTLDKTIGSAVIIDSKGAILLSERNIPLTEDSDTFDFSNLQLVLQDGTTVDLAGSTVLKQLDGFIAVQPQKFSRFVNTDFLEYTTNYKPTDTYYMLIPGNGARQISYEELTDGVELSPYDKIERLNSFADMQETSDDQLGSYAIVNQEGKLVTMTNPNITAANAKQGEAYTANEQTIQTMYRSVQPAV